MRTLLTILSIIILAGGCYTADEAPPAAAAMNEVNEVNEVVTEMKETQLTTVALRVHHMDAMVAFYTEAFGATFKAVDTFGLKSQFGKVAGITLKLVPLREQADFEDYPSHQLGFVVEDVDAVIQLAVKYGGRQEGDRMEEAGQIHAAVRDPDGNTIELYSQ